MLVRRLDPDITERNYAKDPLTRAEVTKILDVVGEVALLVRKRNKTVKENGWQEKAPSKGAFIKAVLVDNNVIDRPVVIRGKRFVVGYDEDAIGKLLA